MFRWEMEIDKQFVLKRTNWVTNSPVLAPILDAWCSNDDGKQPYHHHITLVGGIAHLAAAYPPKLVMAVLERLKLQLQEDGVLSAMDLQVGGPSPTEPTFSKEVWELPEFKKFWDDISGEELPAELVQKARAEEIAWVKSIKLYNKVPRKKAKERGIPIVPVRWVDVNKGDTFKYNVRSRLVGKELKAKTKELLSPHELFCATPPWEVVKGLFSLMVTDPVSENDEELEIGIFDISRAHFMPKVNRELYTELPEEDKNPEDGVCIGELLRNMYGFRDASNDWQKDWQELLQSEGYKIGQANGAIFRNDGRKGKGLVHGDDFYVLGPKGTVDHMATVLKSKYSLRESHRLGFGENCVRQAFVLNRVVSLGEVDGKRFVQFEADARHVDIILKSLNLDNSRTKTVATPSVKTTDADCEKRRRSPLLPRSRTTIYRSNVMRLNFISQDRVDLSEATKSLAQGMAKPTEAHFEDLKRVGRYLKGRPSLASRYWQRPFPSKVTATVDSDHAGDKTTRKSTTGMVLRFGSHVLRASSSLQSAIGLNVSEAEFCALVHGAAHGLGFQAYYADLGIKLDVRLESYSSSAKSFTSRRGLGKQRHVQVRYLWIQERVACKHLVVKKIWSEDNVSDMLTKSVNKDTLEAHLKAMHFLDVPRNALQKTV